VVDGIFSYTILCEWSFGIFFSDIIYFNMEYNRKMVIPNRYLYMYKQHSRRLIDVSNIYDIHFNLGDLYINGMYVTSNTDDIDQFLMGYCAYHDIDFDIVYKKLIDT